MKTNRLAWLALVAICIIWGTTYLALGIAVHRFPPFLFSILRQLTAGLLLLLVFGWGGNWPTLADWPRHFLVGFLMVGLGNGLIGWAETVVPTGLAAVLCASMPLMLLVLNLFSGNPERVSSVNLAGVGLGFFGIVWLFWPSLAVENGNDKLTYGVVAVLVASLAWAVGTLMNKNRPAPRSPFANAGAQLFAGGLTIVPFSLLFDDYSGISLDITTVWAWLYLVVVGSFVAYGAYAYALAHLPAGLVSVYAYINPIVALLLGWAWLNEPLTGDSVFAVVLILGGVGLVNLRWDLHDFYLHYRLYRLNFHRKGVRGEW